MKLHLSKFLLLAVMACYSHIQAETVTLTTANMTPAAGEWYTSFTNVDLALSANTTYPTEDDTELRWISTNNGSYSLSGSYTLNIRDGYFSFGDYSNGGTFTVDSGVTIKSTEYGAISVWGGSYVDYNGTLEGSSELGLVVSIYQNSIVDLCDATLKSGIWFSLSGGTIKCNTLTVSNSLVLSVGSSSSYTNKVDGNLTIAGGGLEFDASGYTNTTWSQLSVTGTLSITGSAIIRFTNEYSSGDNIFIKPESGTVIIKSAEFSGNAGLLTAEMSGYDEDGWNVEESITDMTFVCVTQTDGTYGLTIVDGTPGSGSGDESEAPVGPSTIITEGLAPETLDSDTVIYLSAGGTVDATEVSEGLCNEFISGAGGELITNADQVFSLNGTDDLGFSIVGVDGVTGSSFLVGKASGGSIADANITLSGQEYQAESTTVQSGLLTISANTTLGTATSTLFVGLEDYTGSSVIASVNNLGTIANDVVINPGATLYNEGTIKGDVSLTENSLIANNGTIEGTLDVVSGARAQGSGTFNITTVQTGGTLYVGNSPGYQYHSSLTLEEGANLIFSVEGIVAASLTSSGSGTYSYLTTDSLTLNGTSNVSIEVGLGILAAGTEEFSLTLMDATVEAGSTGDLEISVVDDNNLLQTSSFNWDAETGQLTFTGQVDETAIAALVSGDGSNIANALWSSTASVKNFAQTAAAQSKVQQEGQTNFWATGLGDFMDMSSSNGVTGFSYSGGGYAAGADYSISKEFRLGIALGQTFGEFKSDDGQARIDQDGIMTGLYANYVTELSKTESFGLNAYFAYGNVENDANTYIGNTSTLPGSAEWDDTVFTFGITASWAIQVRDTTALIPFIGIEYTHGAQDSFTESFSNGERQYSNGNMQVWSMPIGITVKEKVELGNGQILLPELTLAYVGDIARNNPKVESSLYGITNTSSGTNPGRSAFMLSTGANWLINENWSVGAFYTMEARTEQFSQSATLSARYSF